VLKDPVNFRDSIKVSIETEVVPPTDPCPECGAETRPDTPLLGETPIESRICSSRVCRTISVGLEEQKGSARFPCPALRSEKQWVITGLTPGDDGELKPIGHFVDGPMKPCGKETKQHTDGSRPVIARRRICSSRICRHVVSVPVS